MEGTLDATGGETSPGGPRWWIHLVLLGSYPLVVGGAPFLLGETEEALLPPTASGLVFAMLFELVVFGVVFVAAWAASRASADQLLLKWNGGIKPVLRGLGYSIGLRVALAVVIMIVAFVLVQFAGLEEEALEGMQPRTEAVVDANILAEDPVYFALTLTLVSFVVAGFREELWRAGVLAGLVALFPRAFGSLSGRLVAVGIAAVLFGLGHLSQGIGGAVLTTVLGFGLGAIMVVHRSIWDAVFAHGFFNAMTFVMLYLLVTRAPHLLPGG